MLLTIAVGTFVSVQDQTAVTLAMPRLADHFDAAIPVVQWVALGYILTTGSLLLPMGRLSDLIGRKIIYVVGFSVFIIGALLAGSSPSLPTLIGCRIFQGVGAAMVQANSMAILTSTYPTSEHGKVIGLFMTMVGLGAIAGPIVGGVVVDLLGWRAVFFMSAPLGIVSLVSAIAVLDRSRPVDSAGQLRSRAFDWLGALLSAASLVIFLLAMTNAYRVGWTSPLVVSAFAATVVLSAAFLYWETRCKQPMLPLELFRRRMFSLGSSASFFSFLAGTSVFFLIPFYLQDVIDLSPAQAGLVIGPTALCFALLGPISGKLSDRYGSTRFEVIGLVLLGSSLLGWQGTAVQPQTGDQPMVVAAAARAENVAIIPIRGPIDQITPKVFKRRIELAERQGADAIVIELDTPGGEVGAVLEICNMLKGTSVPNTVAWINRDAYSGGAIIALACKEIVVNDPATLGDALVVQMDPIRGINELSEAERQKFLAPLLVEVVDSARRHGYDEKLVQGIVSLGVELWMIRNKENPRRVLFIDAAEYERIYEREPDRSATPMLVAAPPLIGQPTAPTPPPGDSPQENGAPTESDHTAFDPASPVLEPLTDTISSNLVVGSRRPTITPDNRHEWTEPVYYASGRGLVTMRAGLLLDAGLATAVVKTDAELMSYFGASAMDRLEPTLSGKAALQLAFLTNPIIRALLLMVFLTTLMIELHAPGLGVPGAIAAAALIAFLAPSMLVGLANWWEVVAIGAGIILLAVGLLVLPGFGVFGIAGVILLLGGIVYTFVGDSSSPFAAQQLTNGIMATVLAFASAGAAIIFLHKHLGSLPFFNRLVLSRTVQGAEDSGDEMLAAMGLPAETPIQPGAIGRTTTPLKPVGHAVFGDRVVDVRSQLGYVDAGVAVRVVSAAEFDRLIVEPIDEQPQIGESPA